MFIMAHFFVLGGHPPACIRKPPPPPFSGINSRLAPSKAFGTLLAVPRIDPKLFHLTLGDYDPATEGTICAMPRSDLLDALALRKSRLYQVPPPGV